MAEDDQEVTDVEDTGPEATANPRSRLRLAVTFGLVAVVGLAAQADCMGTRIYQSYQGNEQRNLFSSTSGTGKAINLTTIDWQHADK